MVVLFSYDKANAATIAMQMPIISTKVMCSDKKAMAKMMVKTGCNAPATVVTCAALPSDLYAAKLHKTPKPFKKPAKEPNKSVF